MAEDIFNYINEVYSLLSDKDKGRIGETWKAFEQTYGDVWTKVFERGLAVNVNTTPLYNNQRWLKHMFNASTRYDRTAVYRSNQDLSKGINLSVRYLVKLSVDGGSPIEVDLRGSNSAATQNTEIRDKINAAFGFQFASLVVLEALLELVSPTSGPTSKITFYVPSDPLADASALILDLRPFDNLGEISGCFIGCGSLWEVSVKSSFTKSSEEAVFGCLNKLLSQFNSFIFSPFVYQPTPRL